MCQITLSKSTEKKQEKNSSDICDRCGKNHATSPQKNYATSIFLKLFFITFGKSKTHLTTNVMFSGQGFAILAMILCGEIAWFKKKICPTGEDLSQSWRTSKSHNLFKSYGNFAGWGGLQGAPAACAAGLFSYRACFFLQSLSALSEKFYWSEQQQSQSQNF